ncbi:MAG: hypothetical protein KAS86_05165, partial [Candidatus Omnitrophica bacterium]|nr:hypothetical protein [Candidatus Omnitrophota bacterium]
INVDAVKRGVSLAFLPGRIEVLCLRPVLVIDGAQNRESAARLKCSVERIFKQDKVIVLLGLSGDKDIRGVCAELLPLADEFILTRASVKRAADPDLIKGYIKGREVRIADDVRESLGIAFSRAGKNDLILATGSFFLISEIRELMIGSKAAGAEWRERRCQG